MELCMSCSSFQWSLFCFTGGEGSTGWAVLNLLLGMGLTKPWDWGCDSQLLTQASGERIPVCCSRNEGPTRA